VSPLAAVSRLEAGGRQSLTRQAYVMTGSRGLMADTLVRYNLTSL